MIYKYTETIIISRINSVISPKILLQSASLYISPVSTCSYHTYILSIFAEVLDSQIDSNISSIYLGDIDTNLMKIFARFDLLVQP